MVTRSGEGGWNDRERSWFFGKKLERSTGGELWYFLFLSTQQGRVAALFLNWFSGIVTFGVCGLWVFSEVFVGSQMANFLQVLGSQNVQVVP